MTSPLARRCAAAAFLSSMAACGPSLPDPGQDAEALRGQGLGTFETAKKDCHADRPATEADLFGWDPGSRGKIATNAEEGAAVVHFEQRGCEIAIRVLDCTVANARYAYQPYSEVQRKIARDELDLYARFPVAAAHLRARVGGGRGLRADYRLVGIDKIGIQSSVGRGDLRGPGCAEATHLVSKIYRGSFAIGSASFAELEAKGELFGGGAAQRIEVFDSAGTVEACQQALQSQKRTAYCDAPLRLELRAIEGVESAPPPPATAASPAPARGACPAGMVAIPSGTFSLGSTDAERERPVHSVLLHDYCLDETEVTVRAYAGCVRAGTCRAPATDALCNAPGTGKDEHPQNCVAWTDASAYCHHAGKRLPTEAEWENAARGGVEKRAFPWGSTPPAAQSACWDRWARRAGTCRVKSSPAGAYGLSDMAGNVWEWVADWYGPYPGGSADWEGPATGSRRVFRGGAWDTEVPGFLRGAHRDENVPEVQNPNLGLRCAKTL
jgi:formylglycine-generating enzyme required for sulfatase activity